MKEKKHILIQIDDDWEFRNAETKEEYSVGSHISEGEAIYYVKRIEGDIEFEVLTPYSGTMVPVWMPETSKDEFERIIMQSQPSDAFKLILAGADEVRGKACNEVYDLVNKTEFPELLDLSVNNEYTCNTPLNNEVFTNTERLNLIQEDIATFAQQDDKLKFVNTLEKLVINYIQGLTHEEQSIIIYRNKELKEDYPNWLAHEIWEYLHSADDFRDILVKLERKTPWNTDRHLKHWLPFEISKLERMFRDGEDYATIAQALRRTENAICGRLKEMNLIYWDKETLSYKRNS